jgi:hypothetical protein
MAKHVQARVLVDAPAHGLRINQVAEGDPVVIKALAAHGVVDTTRAAVDYALSHGGKVVKVEAAEGPQQDAKAAQISDLEAQAAASQGEERLAIEAKLAELRKA